MFLELLYYFPIVTLLNLGAYLCLEYISDEETFVERMKANMASIVWWSIDKYNSCKGIFERYIVPLFGVDECIQYKYLCYNKITQETSLLHDTSSFNENTFDSYVVFYNNYTITIENNKKTIANKYIQYQTYEDTQIERTQGEYVKQNPFIQLEIHYENNVLDVTSICKPFMIPDNVFDSDFFQFICKYYHNIDISQSDFTIHYMDSSIMQNTITKESGIRIMENNAYEILDK